jgi:hypothetical protein
MNYLLRPRIWPSFRASSGFPSTGPGQAHFCDVLFKYASDAKPLRVPGGTPIYAVSRHQFMKHPG